MPTARSGPGGADPGAPQDGRAEDGAGAEHDLAALDLGPALGAEADTETRPEYRLYALPGGPPHRPGLLRVTADEGGSIDTEVWALPPTAFGAFVATKLKPRALGTLRLADGTAPKGFPTEAAGVAGAADITRFGGWRRYVASHAAA
jgi:hypothetical protein